MCLYTKIFVLYQLLNIYITNFSLPVRIRVVIYIYIYNRMCGPVANAKYIQAVGHGFKPRIRTIKIGLKIIFRSDLI